MNFYSVIIGTELLNGRREDKHFKFLNQKLREKNLKHFANFVIVDNPPLMQRVFKMIKDDPNSVMFCFGGIGATPDDYTREVAAKVFTDGKMEQNETAAKLIIDRFKKEAFPHRINMANLPIGAKLLENVVNQVPGFYLEDRFFFTPGFPSMSWHMVEWALDNIFENESESYSCSFNVLCTENDILDIMKELPQDIEFSSLPKIEKDNKSVEIYLESNDKEKTEKWCNYFKKEISKRNISFIPS